MNQQTITEFLEARIAEDEAAAQSATPGAWEATMSNDDYPPITYTVFTASHGDTVAELAEDSRALLREGPQASGINDASFIARHHPARILAECAAKRAIIAGIIPERDPQTGQPDYDPLWVIRELAAVYADHADYQQEWAQ